MNNFEAIELLEHYFPDANIFADTIISRNSRNIIGRIYVDNVLAFKGTDGKSNFHPCNAYREMGLRDINGELV